MNNKTNTEQIVQAKYSAYLKIISAFADMEAAVPHFSSSAASQKAKFSPGKNTAIEIRFIFIESFFTSVNLKLRTHIHMWQMFRGTEMNKSDLQYLVFGILLNTSASGIIITF